MKSLHQHCDRQHSKDPAWTVFLLSESLLLTTSQYLSIVITSKQTNVLYLPKMSIFTVHRNAACCNSYSISICPSHASIVSKNKWTQDDDISTGGYHSVSSFRQYKVCQHICKWSLLTRVLNGTGVCSRGDFDQKVTLDPKPYEIQTRLLIGSHTCLFDWWQIWWPSITTNVRCLLQFFLANSVNFCTTVATVLQALPTSCYNNYSGLIYCSASELIEFWQIHTNEQNSKSMRSKKDKICSWYPEWLGSVQGRTEAEDGHLVLMCQRQRQNLVCPASTFTTTQTSVLIIIFINTNWLQWCRMSPPRGALSTDHLMLYTPPVQSMDKLTCKA